MAEHLTGTGHGEILTALLDWFRDHAAANPEMGIRALRLPDMTGIPPRPQDRDAAQRMRFLEAEATLADARWAHACAAYERARAAEAGEKP